MRFRPTFQKTLYVLLLGAAALLAIAAAVVIPIQRYELHSHPITARTLKAVDALIIERTKSDSLQVGWGKASLIEDTPRPMAGYGPRGPYESIHDTLFARVMVFDNGQSRVAVVSVDLMIFPPEVKHWLEAKSAATGHRIDFYYSATHTHNGFGGWDSRMAGQAMAGRYQRDIVEKLGGHIWEALQHAEASLQAAEVYYGKAYAPEWVRNRLVETEEEDPWLRFLKVRRSDNSQAAMAIYSAHATCLSKKLKVLSRDYPGVLVDSLEAHPHIDFAMFCAGMVGSHAPECGQLQNFAMTDSIGKGLAGRLLSQWDSAQPCRQETRMGFANLELPLTPPQVHISEHLTLRPWIFQALADDLYADARVFALGNVMMVGMPCDFSGELFMEQNVENIVHRHDRFPIVTSFNGSYIGYITSDEHYDQLKKAEVREMNWVGPGYGGYFTEILKKLLQK